MITKTKETFQGFSEFYTEVLEALKSFERRHDAVLANERPAEEERRRKEPPPLRCSLEDLDLFEEPSIEVKAEAA